jgi:hypothetical protein
MAKEVPYMTNSFMKGCSLMCFRIALKKRSSTVVILAKDPGRVGAQRLVMKGER